MSKLSREAVLVQALRLADREGLEGLTIRRLAAELEVTPMALYWHFKNKEELFTALVDHVLRDVIEEDAAGGSWNVRLRVMVAGVIDELRAHPCLPDLLDRCDRESVNAFLRLTDSSLALLREAGFTLAEGAYTSSYLLTGAIGLVRGQPEESRELPPEEAAERRRLHRLSMESLPADRFPSIVEYAATLEEPVDIGFYHSFGLDLLMSGVEAMAARKAPSNATPNNTA
ncbi:TetR family transcriptional regulator [Streptosporangium soli]|nr:TetR family transcriptional regulator [Streptosporangium sp. KLBMP 9127]